MSGPQRLGELLGPIVGTPASDTTPDRQVAAVWEKAVGPEVARNARPLYLRRGRLSVATSSPAWAQTLQLLSGRVISGVNEALGVEVVKDVRFRHAGWLPTSEVSADAAEPNRPRRPLTPAEETAVAEAARLAGDEELGRRIAAAMRADLEGRPA